MKKYLILIAPALFFAACGDEEVKPNPELAKAVTAQGLAGSYRASDADCKTADDVIAEGALGRSIAITGDAVSTMSGDGCKITYLITKLTKDEIESRFYKAEGTCKEEDQKVLEFLNGKYAQSEKVLRITKGDSCAVLVKTTSDK